MKRAVIFLSAAIILTVGCRQKGAPAADLLPSAAFDTTINNVPVARYEHIACDPFQSYAVATLITGLQGMCVNVVPHVYVKCPAV